MAKDSDPRGDKAPGADKPVEATPLEARQGMLGRPVLMVLIGGLVAAAIAWVIAGQYGESIESQSTQPQTATDTKPVVTPSNQKVIDNTPPAGERMEPAPADRDPTPQSGSGGDSQSVTPTGTEKTP